MIIDKDTNVPNKTDFISREAAKTLIHDRAIETALNNVGFKADASDILEHISKRSMDWIDEIPAADVRPVPEGGIGEMSDGHHTFNGLYYQRMVLFAALVKVYKDKAWKSWRHEDGELCFGKDNYFIVGIDTPQGSYTYHYHGEHWNLFQCEELPVAKHWDGHTEKDVTRLLLLDVRPVVRGRWEDETGYIFSDLAQRVYCPVCKSYAYFYPITTKNFCPTCGADMREVKVDG